MRQRGNVLFLILITVALFAAVGYAITTSTRNGGGNVSKETARTNASAILDYAATINAAVTRMRTVNGCKDTMFDFTNSVFKLRNGAAMNSANNTAPTDNRCHLFNPQGGNIPATIFPVSAVDPNGGNDARPGHSLFRVGQVANIGTSGPGGTASANELFQSILYLNKATCLAINDILGIASSGGEPPGATQRSDGDYINGSYAGGIVYNAAAITGKTSFCVRTTAGIYEFLSVMIAR